MNHTGATNILGTCSAIRSAVRRGTAAGAAAVTITAVAAVLAVALAQDVPGIEICTNDSRMDRRTSCLQSNVEFLQRVITKNSLDGQQRLAAVGREIAALKEQLAAAGREAATLKGALAALEARLAQLEKAAPQPKPDAKK
jgi:septal ring factor EnvC (AmiA/AmiB activator)